MRPRVLIVGGGIGGLTAAVALQQARCDVVVLERAELMTAAGAGLLLQANALAALEMVGVASDVRAAGVEMRGARISSRKGDLIAEIEAPEAEPLGVGIHRAALHEILSRHAGRVSLRIGARAVRYRLVGDRVAAVLESGEEAVGDLLVGADGIHSAVRAQHLSDGSPRYCGYTCWRGIDPKADQYERGRMFEIWGAGQRFGGLHVDERLYWFAPLNAPAGGRDEPGRTKTRLLELYDGWPEEVRATIASTPESAIIRNDIIDRPFRKDWGRGRVTLLGDAAHPMAPDMGQGACQAIEDAVVLGRCMAHGDDPVAALRRYERERRARTRRFVNRSRAFGRVAQWENPTARRLRDGIMRAVPRSLARWDVRRTQRFRG